MATGRPSGESSDEDGGGWPRPTDGPQGRTDQPPTGRSRSAAVAFWAVLIVALLGIAGYAVFTWVLSRPDANAATSVTEAAEAEPLA